MLTATSLFIFGAVAFFSLLLGGLGYVLIREHRKQSVWINATRRALAEGQPATALVTAMGPSGRGRLVFAVHLDVKPARDRAFQVVIEAYVPPYAAGAFGPGKRVAVRYVLADRAVAIDYPAMGYAAPPGW